MSVYRTIGPLVNYNDQNKFKLLLHHVHVYYTGACIVIFKGFRGRGPRPLKPLNMTIHAPVVYYMAGLCELRHK